MTQSPNRRKRLIEVSFPLEEVSAHSRREKNIRHGHISTLHIWWARRPLAACRAFIYASLVDDPETNEERDALLKEVADLANWDAVRKPEHIVRAAPEGSGLTGNQLLERARQRILACNDGVPPRLLDPFAGGGAIPLEALRLGCDVEASDLNPVAVLILKGTVEYPQRYGRPLSEQKNSPLPQGVEVDPRVYPGGEVAGIDGQVPIYILEAARLMDSSFGEADAKAAYERNPLAADVRYWGNWMLERAREELSTFYPPDPDGSIPVAYLWSRTVPCPSCNAQMPLIRQYWLARKEKKKIALEPFIDQESGTVDFRVVEGSNIVGNPANASTSKGDTRCLVCGQVTGSDLVRSVGAEGKISDLPTAVVLSHSDSSGKTYRPDNASDAIAFAAADRALMSIRDTFIGGLPAVPDEPNTSDPANVWISKYGFNAWGKLFNARQLLALTSFARLVHEAHAQMIASGISSEYAKAITTFLGFAVDRLADYNSTITRWASHGEYVGNTFTRQAIPMVWDYSEVNPFSGQTGDLTNALAWIIGTLEPSGTDAKVVRRDARQPSQNSFNQIVTDPPYYDSINYADLSDFFYVWMKRSLGFLHPELLSLPLTPKRDQVVMNVYSNGSNGKSSTSKSTARQQYVQGMASSFSAIAHSLEPSGMVGVVFAHTDPEAWGTLIEGLLHAGLIPNASWPIDTELENKASNIGQARLKTSVWMACRPRRMDAGEAFLGDLVVELRNEVRGRLLDFWKRGIRGSDFFLSAIGPALSVYGRHTRVLKPGGEEVTVREFLDLVRREATQFALEAVLEGADLGQIDPISQQYLTWVWSYGRAPLDPGDAIALCLATGSSYPELVRPGSIAVEYRDKSKKLVRLRSIAERIREEEEFAQPNGARATPLIDQLQHAAHLWGLTRSGELTAYRTLLGEQRWHALSTLGQAVAGCLPNGDEEKRTILGLLTTRMPSSPTNGEDNQLRLRNPAFQMRLTNPSSPGGTS